MKLDQFLKYLYESTDNRRYCYLSNDPERLNSISNDILSLVDFDKATTLVFIVYAQYAHQLQGAYDGIFFDTDVAPADIESVSRKPDCKLYKVGLENNEVVEQSANDLLH